MPKKTKAASNPETNQPRTVNDYSATLRDVAETVNPLRAFAPKPLNIFFDSQLQEEKIVLLLRKHPITLIKPALIALVIFLMPVLFVFTNFGAFLPLNYQFAFFIGWVLVLVGFVLETFLVWFFSVYIITDERIIDVDFLSFIYKNISSAKIDKIEDVTVSTGGTLASLADFGDVQIQTAGEKVEIVFESVPQPSKVAAILNELMLEEEREKLEGRAN